MAAVIAIAMLVFICYPDKLSPNRVQRDSRGHFCPARLLHRAGSSYICGAVPASVIATDDYGNKCRYAQLRTTYDSFDPTVANGIVCRTAKHT